MTVHYEIMDEWQRSRMIQKMAEMIFEHFDGEGKGDEKAQEDSK